MKTWCHWLAKEGKRQPRLSTRPPTTAVILVDFRLQMATVRGETRSDTQTDSAPTAPGPRHDISKRMRTSPLVPV